MDRWIEPGFLIRTAQNHRHPVVDLLHEVVGRSRQDRKRAALVCGAGTPRFPNPGNAHDGFVFKEDLEWPFETTLSSPFEEPAQRNDAALANDKIPIQPAVEHRFASRIDR